MESAINISQQRMERMEMFAINGQPRLFENSGRGEGSWNSEDSSTTWWWNNWPRELLHFHFLHSFVIELIAIVSTKENNLPFRNYARLASIHGFPIINYNRRGGETVVASASGRIFLFFFFPFLFPPFLSRRQIESWTKISEMVSQLTRKRDSPVSLEEFKFDWERVVRKDRHACFRRWKFPPLSLIFPILFSSR